MAFMKHKVCQRWVLTVAYDGGSFHGWQKQPGEMDTIQARLEAALGHIAGEPIHVVVAGRTDAGVHATAQVVHFDTSASRPPAAWTGGINAIIDQNIRILTAQPVAAHFHARFDAQGRHYRYVLESGRLRMPQLRGKVGWTYLPLNMTPMCAAAATLVGEHDFSSFRSSDCQAKSPIKTLYNITLSGNPELMAVDVHGSAFLHHMVRNIVGALVYVGAGKISVAEFQAMVNARNRQLAPPTFMPDGLYLTGVDYPQESGLQTPPLPAWLWPHLSVHNPS